MTTAADYTSVRFLEPFLNACDAPTLLAATAVCKTWAASAKSNSLWRPLVLRRWPLPWLQSDGQDACNWLKRYATLSKGMPAATQADDDDSDPAAMLEELKASHQFFLVGRSAHWRTTEEWRTDPSDGREYTKAEFIGEYGGTAEWESAAVARRDHDWETGDVVFSCPLQLRMGRVPVYFGEGGEGWIGDGLTLAAEQLEVPVVFSPAVYTQGGYNRAHAHGCKMDLAIYAKSSERVAHMLTMPGCALSHESPRLFYVYEASLSACPLKQRATPAWTRCITHAGPDAGPSDDFVAEIHFDGEDNFDGGDISCTRMRFHLHRNAFLARDGDFMTLGEPVACRVRLPMCVRDMPDILEKLVWA